MQQSERWIIERTKGQDGAINVSELCQALQSMPNGYSVMGIQNRDDGTTIVHLQAPSRKSVTPTR